ncbi:MAG: cupin domain-containing protein [Bacteroidetes bacterium]|nr:cupin domain-containing protein [Bacteroidota bacterium]MBS1633160.1 cupin domain-containing protein [Bacteroidota bacterium]
METIKNNKPLEIVPGITGYYAHGEKMTFGYVELLKGASIPAHQHPQEQITYIIEGELDMMIGETNCILTPGMYRVIPSGIPHSAIARTFCKLIDAFSPARGDYR